MNNNSNIIKERNIAEEKYRLFFENIAEPILVANADTGMLINANQAAQKLFGYSLEEFKNLHQTNLHPPNPFFSERFKQSVQRLLDTRTAVQIVTKSGEIKEVEVTSYGYYPEGDINVHIGLFHDITEQTRLEQELKRAREEAEKLLQLKSQFLSNMSHEIRTPMNAIIGMADLLSETSLTEDQKIYVETIKNSSNALISVINGILDFSKLESGKYTLEIVPFIFSDLIEQMKHLFIHQSSKNVNFEFIIPEKIPPLLGDSSKVRQILINLIGNAYKFTKNGFVKIEVEILEESNQIINLLIKIIDSGIGISQDKLNTLFIPFSQVDVSTTRIYGGTGLGLSICKQLVELMNGKIGVETEYDKGSTFWFSIPFQKTQIKIENNSNINTSNLKFNSKVMVVDDNKVNQTVIQKLLNRFNLEVVIANNGEDCLNNINNSFSLIFMDLHMPIMDGYETTSILRKKGFNFPIIALTADSLENIKDKCFLIGMNDFLLKPVKTSQIEILLKKYLS